MKLNLGCGYKKDKDYTNVDCDPLCFPDITCDLEHDVWPFDDNSVEYVQAHHILEHMGDGFFHFMKQLYRVCKPGCLIDIIVPHHRHDVFFNDPTHKRPITIGGLQMFSKSFNKLCIETNDSTSTIGLQYDVDFDIVQYNFSFDGAYKQLLDNPQRNRETIEQIAREYNNVIVEINVQLVVIKDN